MRVVHLADTHLGFRQFSGCLDPERNINQREADVYRAWHAAIDTAIAREVDLVVHAGDLFDASRPSPLALREALTGFRRLREAGIPAVVVAGNHSTPRFRSGGSIFGVLEEFGVNAIWDAPRTITVGGIAVHGVPHDADPERLEQAVRAARPSAQAAHNLLLLHVGLESVPRSGEVGEVAIHGDALVEAGSFDYIALGHLHRFQAPQVNALYAGSLERLDFNDLAGAKAVVEIDLDRAPGTSGYVTRHPFECRPVVDLAVSCEGLSASEVLDAVAFAADPRELAAAVVRVRLQAIRRDVYAAIPRDAIRERVPGCLHHFVHVTGSAARTGDQQHEHLDFATFARRAMPADVDADAVVALSERFLGEAAAAEAEAEAEGSAQ
jgi:DNA repair exonuclease SbcCD nuclease subunit